MGRACSKTEKDNSIKFRFFRATRPKVAKMVTGLSIAAVLLYAPQWQTGSFYISEGQFTRFIAPALGSVQSIYKDITFTETLKDFVYDIARRGLENQKEFQLLPKEVKEQAIREAAEQILANSEKTLGVTVVPETPLMSVIYKYAIAQLGNLQARLGNTFIIVWGIGAFFVFRGVGAILVWVVGLVGFALYELLLAFQAVRIRGESKVKENVEFS